MASRRADGNEQSAVSDVTVIAVPRQRIKRLEQRVGVLEALVQRLSYTYEQLPRTIGDALKKSLSLDDRANVANAF